MAAAADDSHATTSIKRTPQWMYITPLIFTMLPLVRIGLRNHPVLRTRVFLGLVGVGVVHGSYLIFRAQDEEPVTEYMSHKDVTAALNAAASAPRAVAAADAAAPVAASDKQLR